MIEEASKKYETTIDEAIGFLKTSDHSQTKEYLLIFRDVEGCQVTLRLRHTAIDSLAKKLELGASPEPS